MAGATASPSVPAGHPTVPGTFEQVLKLTRYQLREYLRSLRFVALVGIVLGIAAILTAIVAHFRGGIIASSLAFYGSAWGGGISFVIVLAAVFFGGDAIAGEFQNKTGYFLMGLPIRRGTIYVGKFIAAYAASVSVMGIYLAALLANGAYYFGSGALPWQLGLSFGIGLVYLAAVLGTTFVFSSLFKTSAYGFVLTALLFLVGFSIIEAVLEDLANLQPFMIISYASDTMASVFSTGVNWGLKGVETTSVMMVGRRSITTNAFAAGVGQGLVVMLVYLIETFAVGLWLFEREEFT